MTQHIEASERSMQDRIQRLEAIRIALEEVRMDAPGELECSREVCQGSFVESSIVDQCKNCHML